MDQDYVWPVPEGQKLECHWESNEEHVDFFPVVIVVIDDDLHALKGEQLKRRRFLQSLDK